MGENLTTAQAASFLNVKISTLNQWRWLQTGPKYARFGRRSIRYRRDDLVEYVAACITGGSSEVVAH